MSANLRFGNLLAVLFAGGGLIACNNTAATSGYALSSGVLCLPPAASGLITNFTYVPDEALDEVHFGNFTKTLSGTEFLYPTGTDEFPLGSSVTNNNWNITGTVGNSSGFGFHFDIQSGDTVVPCTHVDAAGFKGMSFDISGIVMGGSLTFEVDTLEDIIAASWVNTHLATGQTAVDPSTPGDCIPGSTATDQDNQTDCTPATYAVAVGATPTTVSLLWSDFSAGKPQAMVTPSDIIGIRWVLPAPAGAGTASVTTYSINITVDNVAFIPE
jgi:hypothetical protein